VYQLVKKRTLTIIKMHGRYVKIVTHIAFLFLVCLRHPLPLGINYQYNNSWTVQMTILLLFIFSEYCLFLLLRSTLCTPSKALK